MSGVMMVALAFVGRDSGHDIGTTHGLCHAGAYTHRHGQVAQVGKQFAGGLPVRIEKTQFGDAQQVVESQAWNSLCAPLPISAMLRLPGRPVRAPPRQTWRQFAMRW